ncbi:MAG TPA: hypothetical protein G4N98_05560 [Thermoflexia bacterium]|nr:hypothetical protein [Thermoflexia bacterium]
MEAIRVQQIMAEDGAVMLTGLPYKKGQAIEIILLLQSSTSTTPRACLTVQRLRASGLIGLWKDRTDIQDSAAYARQLRKQAERREGISYAPVR